MIFNFLKKLTLAGIIFIISLALLGDYGKILFPFGRVIIFQAIIEILFLGYFFSIVFDKNSRPNLKSPVIITAILFWFANFLALFFSLDKAHSFFGDPRRMNGFFTLSHIIIFFLILIGTLKSWNDWKKIFYFIIFLSIPASLYGIWQKLAILDRFARAYGSLDNSNFFAAYLLFPIFINLALLFSSKRRLWKFFHSFVLLLQLIAFYLAFSRGAITAMALGLIIFIIFQKQWKFKIKIIGFGIIIALGTAFLIINLNYIKIQIKDLSNYYRLELWRNAIMGIKEKPIFGFGQENFQIAFDKYYRGNWERKETMGAQTDKTHNIFLEQGATTGILGLIFYLLLWTIVFWLLLGRKYEEKNKTDPPINLPMLKTGLIAAMAAYFIQGLFNIETLIPSLYFWTIIGFADFLYSQTNEPQNKKIQLAASNIKKKLFFIAFPVLIIAVLFFFRYFNLNPIVANFYQNKARNLTIALPQEKISGIKPEIREKQFLTAFNFYEKALGKSIFIDPYIRFDYASSIAIFTNFTESSKKESKKYLEKSVGFLEKNFLSRPYYSRDWWLAGKLSNLAFTISDNKNEKDYWLQKSDYYFSKAIAISPQRPLILTEWGQMHLTAGQINEAQTKLKKAIEINPDIPEPHWFLALSYIDKKNWPEFEKEKILAKKNGWDIINEKNELVWARFSQLANVLAAAKEYQKLIELYEKAIKIETRNIQLYISLAVSYKESGQKEKARQIIERLFQIEPQLQTNPQILEFLKNL